jgi:hypothetical protein
MKDMQIPAQHMWQINGLPPSVRQEALHPLNVAGMMFASSQLITLLFGSLAIFVYRL